MPETTQAPDKLRTPTHLDADVREVVDGAFADLAEQMPGLEPLLDTLSSLPVLPFANIARARRVLFNEQSAAHVPVVTGETATDKLTRLWHTTSIIIHRASHKRVPIGTQAKLEDMPLPNSVINGDAKKLLENVETAEQFITLPVTLLRVCSAALLQHFGDEVRAGAELKALAHVVFEQDELASKPPKGAPIAERIAWGAMAALRDVCEFGDVDHVKEDILIYLAGIGVAQEVSRGAAAEGVSDEDLSRRLITSTVASKKAEEQRSLFTSGAARSAKTTAFDMNILLPDLFARLCRQLEACGIPDCSRLTRKGSKVEVYTQHYGLKYFTQNAVREELLKNVSAIHCGLRARQVGLGLVQAILTDRIDFMALSRALDAPVLGFRAQEQEVRMQEEQARRAQELADKLARIHEVAERLGFRVLPMSDSSDRDAPRTLRQVLERNLDNPNLQLERVLAIEELVGWPGARWYMSNPEALTGNDGRPRKEGEEYIIILLPFIRADGSTGLHVLADTVAGDNALFLCRGDANNVGNVDLEPEEIFGLTKNWASGKGAVRVQHPRQKDYIEDDEEVSRQFVTYLLDLLIMDPAKYNALRLGRNILRFVFDRTKKRA